MTDDLAAKPALVRRHYIDGRWGQVHLRAAGSVKSPKPPLVCLHQSPLSGRMYEPFLAEMGRDRLVVAPDTPGYGHSDPPPGKLSIAEYAEVHGHTIDTFCPGTIDVLGTHTGARMAVEVALQRPQQVKHLILVGAAVYTEEELAKQKQWTGVWLAPTEGSDGSHLLTMWNTWARFRAAGVTDAMIERYVADSLYDRSRARWAPDAVFAHDMGARLRLVGQPVLVFNARDDIYEATNRAAACLKRGRVVDMSPAGLALLEVKTGEIVVIVRQFLDRG